MRVSYIVLVVVVVGTLISGCPNAEGNPAIYAVTYDGNGHTGGSVPVDNNLYADGDAVSAASPGTMIRTDYVFFGWNTASDGGGTALLAGSSLTITDANVTLYAIWISDSPLFTEILYDASTEPDGEWIEVYNPNDFVIDLSAWVFDDADGTYYASANIASGTIPAKGTAVFYNADIAASQFIAEWGAGINLIAVSEWPALNNTGDQIGLWSSLASYLSDDRTTPSNAEVSITYDAGSALWPDPPNGTSVYMPSIAAEPANGTNWAISADGTGGAYTSMTSGEVGSPGGLP